MKRFLLSLLCAIVSFSAMAEGPKRLINIDPATFRPVQKDALTGVNIDAIGKDRSQRPCARIKLHINRMSREDIDQLVVYPIGGNIELTRKMTSYEGNGLIIEMTAKQPTRFFIRHEKYGDSNEVSLNLEGSKEYYLDGQLDLLLPVTVATNVVGAEVYFDREYKGLTDDNGFKTISEVMPGKHSIMVVYENYAAKQDVEVNNDKISFRLTVNNKPAVAENTPENILPQQLIVPEIKTYKVGDYYNDGKKEGVVFWVTDGGKHGKIVSMVQSSGCLQWTSDMYEAQCFIGVDNENDGAKNMDLVSKSIDWRSKYPAFRWCANLGEGWYLPAIEELKMFTLDESVNDVVNSTLTKFSRQTINALYWSSTESFSKYADVFCAWSVAVNGHRTANSQKGARLYVRAVAAF